MEIELVIQNLQLTLNSKLYLIESICSGRNFTWIWKILLLSFKSWLNIDSSLYPLHNSFFFKSLLGKNFLNIIFQFLCAFMEKLKTSKKIWNLLNDLNENWLSIQRMDFYIFFQFVNSQIFLPNNNVLVYLKFISMYLEILQIDIRNNVLFSYICIRWFFKSRRHLKHLKENRNHFENSKLIRSLYERILGRRLLQSHS